MGSRLSDHLVAAGLVSAETMRSAIARQAVYGGSLDTALLELQAIAEPALWRALADATGLPLPDPGLLEAPVRYSTPEGSAPALDGEWSERCRAVPAGVKDGVVQLLCGEPVAQPLLEAAASSLGVRFVLFVAPEVRLAAMRQALFERPMPQRLLRLYARLAGAQPVRRWQAAQAKPIQPEETRSVEIFRRPAAAAARGLPPATDKRQVTALIAALGRGSKRGPGTSDAAAGAPSVVPSALPSAVPSAASYEAAFDDAHAALVAITGQDLGPRRRPWEIWWEKHKDEERLDWLFEALSHKKPELRAAAEEELRALTGQYFGYHFDLPRREREEARARWQSWWRASHPR